MGNKRMLFPTLFFAVVVVWSFYSLRWQFGANLPRLITLMGAAFGVGVSLILAVHA